METRELVALMAAIIYAGGIHDIDVAVYKAKALLDVVEMVPMDVLSERMNPVAEVSNNPWWSTPDITR